MAHSDKVNLTIDTDRGRPKILLLTMQDPHDRRSWSGTIYYTAQALQKHCGDVSYLGSTSLTQRFLGRIFHKSMQQLLHKNFMYNHCLAVAKEYAQIVNRRLKQQAYDIIIAPAGATEIAFLQTDIPIVLLEDATFALLHNYYPQFSNLMQRSIDECHQVQRAGITNASVAIYSSAWAARSAIDTYHADPQKVHVVPFGANIDHAPSKDIALNARPTDCCRLLFLGVNWQRKGGDIAFETLLALEAMNIPAELIVCGCTPPQGVTHPKMQVIPFLDKNDERQRNELNNLFLRSHFLLLPTRGDCTPLAFSEANAFGLPVITTETGGVTEIVQNNVNGFTLPLAARGNEYAKLIAELYQDQRQYASLARTSRATFDDKLNWDHWAIVVNSILLDVLKQKAISRSVLEGSAH
jgi:glycosyltransferase involved in cell wall biosynthesis